MNVLGHLQIQGILLLTVNRFTALTTPMKHKTVGGKRVFLSFSSGRLGSIAA